MKQNLYKKIEQTLKKWKRHDKKEKKRCQKAYPDWEDNDKNFYDLKYIFGVTDDMKIAEDFVPLTFLDLIYDRRTRQYEIVINHDTPSNKIIQGLVMTYNAYSHCKNGGFQVQSFDGDIWSAPTMAELMSQLDLFLAGYSVIYPTARS